MFFSLVLSFFRVSAPAKKDEVFGLTGKKYEAELKDEFLLGIINGNLSKELLDKHYSIVNEIDNTKNVKYVKKTFSSFDEDNNLIKYNDFVPVFMNSEDIEYSLNKRIKSLELEEGYTPTSIFPPLDVVINRSNDFKPVIKIINHAYLVVLTSNGEKDIVEFYCDSYDHSLMRHLYGQDKDIELASLNDPNLYEKVSSPFNLINLVKTIISFKIGEEIYDANSFHSIKKLEKQKDKNRFVIKFNVTKYEPTE